MNERMPYYMAYPVPFSYDDERTERRDIEYLRSMYPDIPKRILPYVEEECDRMEYENGVSGSDRSGARESETIEAQSLRDLIEVMLFQEIYRRRCDHRRRCRRFY